MTNLFKELKVALHTPSTIHCDSKAIIQIVANLVFHERTKHIEIDCHFIREKIQQVLIQTSYINTSNNSDKLYFTLAINRLIY